jgi:hypothetical protein
VNKTVDGMFVLYVCVLMVAAGLAGGYVNYMQIRSDTQESDFDKDSVQPGEIPLYGYLITGVVASFIVPLFLSIAKSDLLKEIFDIDDLNGTKLTDMFIFAGFCLVAAISSRAFIQTITRQIFEVKAEQKSLQVGQKSLQVEIAEVIDNFPAPGEQEHAVEEDKSATTSLPTPPLTSAQFRVLEALNAKQYTWRNATGAAKDSGQPLNETRKILGELIQLGLLVERQSQKSGNLLYKLTARGMLALANSKVR